MRVLTLNVAMLPSLDGGERRRRAGAILKRLSGYDLLCLQEVFSEAARKVFVEGLQEEYPHLVTKVHTRDWLQQDSGLFVASKRPVRDWRFQAWTDRRGWDLWADKGVLAVRFERFVLFNLHMQSDNDKLGENADVRASQLAQLAGFVGAESDRPALIAGDLNIHDAWPEYGRMLRMLGQPRDLFAEKNPGEPGFTWEASDLRLDYFLAAGFECSECRVLGFAPELSDHNGVEACVDSKENVAQAPSPTR